MNGTPQSEENSILELLAQGSEYAFTQVFDRYRDKVYNVAMMFLKSTESAEEVVQDVFMKLWLKREKVTEIKNLENYIFFMARNVVNDRFRRLAVESNHRRSMYKEQMIVNNTSERLEDKQYELMLRKAVDTLSPQQKLVYKLAKMEGLSLDEIAERLNISRLTVKTHLARAMQIIREHLKKYLSLYIPLMLAILSLLYTLSDEPVI